MVLFVTPHPGLSVLLQGWRTNLVALQPKVQVSDATLLGAVALMREFAAQRSDVVALLHTSGPHLFTYTCAAMWMASKTGDIRTGAALAKQCDFRGTQGGLSICEKSARKCDFAVSQWTALALQRAVATCHAMAEALTPTPPLARMFL